ncbi:MAG: UDP-3-O-(3-hydroxymyristoyl)glucosamine N-acyltransferase [Deltaproteobacteria bacterium]|jgi:UDP-3-O-[3-hydroxymyristoyl] glucosamine N-acyltransferase|nr:UDP-3-O-(3-hydroxymyristoyl)glucosamine N-acyltransferase [Deltaproteobacteria bacterium]
MIYLSSPKPLRSIVAEAKAKLSETLSLLGGADDPISVELIGDGAVSITGLSSAEEAENGALCFAVKKEYFQKAKQQGAAAIIAHPDILKEVVLDQPGLEKIEPLTVVVFAEPRLLFSVVLGLNGQEFSPPWGVSVPFFKDKDSCVIAEGVSFGPNVYLGSSVSIGRGTRIGPGVYLDDDVSIGQDCIIHPGAVLRYGVKVGNRCQIHSNSVIGEDGFGYNQVPCPAQGRLIHFKNPHLGSVIIEDDVEIGALAAIDRGLVANTVIGRGTKIDNLVQIGHNCQIGRDCIIVSQVGAAGHSQVGDRVFLLGQSGLNHGARIGHDAIIAGQSGVLGSIPPGRNVWTGTPVKPQREEYTSQIMVKKDLPKWRKFLSLFLKGQPWEVIRSEMAGGPEKQGESEVSPKVPLAFPLGAQSKLADSPEVKSQPAGSPEGKGEPGDSKDGESESIVFYRLVCVIFFGLRFF